MEWIVFQEIGYGTARMDALKLRRMESMRSIFRDTAWFAATIIAVSGGCKVGNPLDRTVKVTQQPALDEMNVPSPKMRLAGGVLPIDGESTNRKAASRPVAERSPHDASLPEESSAKPAVARKSPTSPSMTASKSAHPTSQQAAAATADVPAEYAELLDAFRDSPPEVQQQAMRQLLAVAGHSPAATDSPRGITAALKSSVRNLPALPDDAEEPTSMPMRLGSDLARPARDSGVVQAGGSAKQAVANEDVMLASGESIAATHPQPRGQMHAAPRQSEILSVGDSDELPIKLPEHDLESATDAQLYVELATRLERAAAGESEADRYRRQIIARHLMMFAGNPDGAVAALDGMSASEQEFLRHYLLGIWSMVDTGGHPVAARRWSAALPEMRLATQQLSASAESLDVRSLAFCKEIQSFGQVTKFDSNRFDAGQKVILYCEIDSFVAKSTAAGFETQLQGSYEIFDAKGQKVAGQVLPADKQMSANYLRDYFIAYQMSLPTGLEPGDYRLELTMECLNGQKYGQASIPLAINRSVK